MVVPQVSVVPAGPDDRPVLECLWLMFRHDLSEFSGTLPNPDGSFSDDWLQAGLTSPDWAAYLLRHADRPIGLALVRGLSGPVRILNAFFIVRGMRRRHLGLTAVKQVLVRHLGPWAVAFQDDNPAAARFWRTVAADVAGGDWTEERRPVPGQPSLPPDVWISFSITAPELR